MGYKKPGLEEDEAAELNLEDLQLGFDPTGLRDRIAGIIGGSVDLTITVEPPKWGKGFQVVIKSENLASKAGIMTPVFEELYLISSGGRVAFDESKGHAVAWVPVHYSWELKSGGGNGTELLTAWYDFASKKWTFRG